MSTGYTYLAGLQKEHLVTDLLWFGIEGPGTRLMHVRKSQKAEDYSESSITKSDSVISMDVAPTWTWA